MKQATRYILILLGVLLFASCRTQEYAVRGPEGGIAFEVTLPDGFDTAKDSCPMVILMHGIFSSKDYGPMPQLARGLAKAGIASIRFDFDGHGRSEGRKQDMTIEKELADARAVWNYVQSLPYVSAVGLLGHSQGGVVASMTAGRWQLKAAMPLPDWCCWHPAPSSRKLAKGASSSTLASTPGIRLSISAAGVCTSWVANISSPPSSSTSTAPQPPTTVPFSCFMVTATV